MPLCYVETYGCQMNKADSERMLGLMAELDYSPTDDADAADLLILNTCTIREGAADKAISNLGRWQLYKHKRPEVLIALAGCLSQERGPQLQRRMPFIDIVFGTHNLHRLPDLVKMAVATGKPQCEIYEQLPEEMPETPVIRQTAVTAWVNVILGCNFNCTYCIVPQVRGREKSRSPQQIRAEIERLTSEGYREVTLLGQNVTAYGLDDKSGEWNLARLLRYVHDVEGLERIRFLTGHPHHVSDELISTVAELPKACEYFHVPMQAGDDQTLRRMARIYTVQKYEAMATAIRKAMPLATITSDFIVGFPGETEEQFANTCSAVKHIGFDACMTAMYSPRRNTPGAAWERDDALRVPSEIKQDRLRHLNAIVNDVAASRSNELYANSTQDILIEGDSMRNPRLWMGRTRGGKICNFPKMAGYNPGDTVSVKITAVSPWSLMGELAELSGDESQRLTFSVSGGV